MSTDRDIELARLAQAELAIPELWQGRTVLYVRTDTDGTTGARKSDILAVPADGSGEAKARMWKSSVFAMPGVPCSESKFSVS